MLSPKDKIVKEKQFVFKETKYIARLYYHNNKPSLYGEVVYKKNNQRVNNMKNLAREFLSQYKINISKDAKIETTHSAVKKLIKKLEENEK